ncbi:chromate resistance protein [Streptomyces sp. A1-5]|nr:chromate resistance protein [Streptomyces sp. A1-5]
MSGSDGHGVAAPGPGQWVLLSYRMPREPSTPRIAVWRKLKRLGVAQISDGLVALPADARTREQLEWIADEVTEAGGTAGIWLAQPGTLTQERELASAMAEARADEYRKVAEEAGALAAESPAERQRAVRRLRAELRRIARRDFFPPTARDHAHRAVEELAAGTGAVGATRKPSRVRSSAAPSPGAPQVPAKSVPEVPSS